MTTLETDREARRRAEYPDPARREALAAAAAQNDQCRAGAVAGDPK
jgi:hypothetical protein